MALLKSKCLSRIKPELVLLAADMWVLVLTSLLLGGRAIRAFPAIDLQMVSDILSELEELPVEESADDEVSPELSELYHDVELLYRMQTSNISDTREARGLLSKLSFLTGLKLGSFLTSSGTLAASQSINFLGKVLNAALSVSYGNIGGYPGIYPGEDEGPLEGLQKLPTIQEDVPMEDKKREKPNDSLVLLPPKPTSVNRLKSSPESVRQEFLKNHNQRVELFNDGFDKKVTKTRTGRIEAQQFEKVT